MAFLLQATIQCVLLVFLLSSTHGMTVQKPMPAGGATDVKSSSDEVSIETLYNMAGRTRQNKRNRGRQAKVLLEPLPKSMRRQNSGRHSKNRKPSILPKDIESVSILSSSGSITPSIMANITLVNGTELIVDPRQFHQRDDQSLWLAVRAALDVTASEFSAILNNSFFSSRDKLLGIKCGTVKKFSGNSAACKWGLKMEPHAFLQYEKVTGNIVNETGLHIMQDAERSRFYGASPDGLVIDANDQSEGLLEIKCLWGRRNQKELAQFDYCPNRFYDQIQGQLAICDREWCDLMVYIPPTGRFKNYCILRVERDREYWSNVIHPNLTNFCDDVHQMRQDLTNDSS